MPIYEYECNGCGELHEFIQKFDESPKRKCPSCGRLRLRKLVSAAAFHLKGNGWYVTDFRDKKKPADKADAKEGAADKSKSDSTGDTKKDTKSSKDSSGSGKDSSGKAKSTTGSSKKKD